ncbi:phage repressor protein C with HTH and peptisase S24 domain [Hephaestia caeni]|uniref:Phage repressor protein C with HTH and peptisase S24 domain n=1 Tax=Hephaestia caeni TaxID=645617 RepID=A0A397PA67_9SPHN|nr:S24 family peptidase [Hephaestia caeni]RIA44085.1 phage repressor protein C with HTH and peptisase S24 domain [Hephaestia caeni]
MRVDRGLNQKDFGALGGVSITSQQQYEAGKTPPNAEYLYRLESNGIDLIGLFGERSTSPIADEIRRSLSRAENIEAFDLRPVQEIDLAYGLGGTYTDGPVEVRTHHFPRAWLESITATPAELLTIARGRGDSMVPTVLDGDMVLIDRSQRTVREQDALWALTIGDIGMIKRLRVRAERVQMLSDNDRVPPDEAHHEEINIVGRVIFIGRNV